MFGKHPVSRANNGNIKQDAREAMRVVFFRTYKMYLYAQNEISYEYIQIFKNYIKLHEFANCNSFNYDA